MSDIQADIANDQMLAYLNNCHPQVAETWWDVVELSEKIVEQRRAAAIAATASLLINSWSGCDHMTELGEQAHRYALGMAECHEYDVGQAEIPDDLSEMPHE